ncbi:mandelate racemase/muconate lactonizing enzyme family protein [Dactylosporangium sucinum]|uniref:Mandelate racemase n=1 Tax=Dactylosporangium sucinum TaxID=1424081 RepID=A0A917U6C0_9ACTN|nr:mandelate racemase/muconate lactonizing enzyme family protein [Dactylosporangium sucinum]GGM62036.1 mandelate racemase [Dactylosporangium sucinum]
MKITEVSAQVLKPTEFEFQWKDQLPPRRVGMILLRIRDDEGHEGQCITWLAGPGQFEDALPRVRDTLVGRDPHDIEKFSYELTDNLTAPNAVSSGVDIALWDLVGKIHEQPIYKLLGAARDRVRAYASTVRYDTVQEYVDLALQCRDEGFTAYKLHAFGVPDKDIEVCRAVREGVGDTMDLMLDPVNAYDRQGAFKVGKVLEELDFYWYEAPIEDADIQGLTDLTRHFSIPITAVESVGGGLKFVPPYLVNHAVDSVRSVGDWTGGITAMKKTAALCEAFGVKFEPHSYGSTLIQAAHFHVMLAIHNCDLVELPVPTGVLDQGMKDTLRVNAEGYVDAPTKPGLGYEIDEDEIDNLTVRHLTIGDASSVIGH